MKWNRLGFQINPFKWILNQRVIGIFNPNRFLQSDKSHLNHSPFIIFDSDNREIKMNTEISTQSRNQGYTLLIVDDNPTNLGVLSDYLEEQGFEILLAEDGYAGLEIAQFAQPNMILLDVMMPGIDGFETCRRLKSDEKTQNIPVIFMTALESTKDKVNGFKVGGVDYITKPVQQEEVLARISTHLRIQALTQELVQSEKMASLGRLVAGFAHELNTPLGVAIGSASMLQEESKKINGLMEQEEVDVDELLSALDVINKGSDLTLSNLERAANLVTSFKRTAVDQTSEEVRSFHLKEVINDTINTLHSRFKQSDISIQVDCPNLLKVKSLPGALEQILTNLLMNSLIHGFNEGQNAGVIKIKVQLLKKHLHLEYSDNGKGIAAENLEKIFEPFFTTHRAHGGSGLGMYICYNLTTTQLQGTISCESTEGFGVVFKMDYPISLTST
ncbi:MAG: hybrid sensor histidine kinase/response regulator [Candidatus Parabeggiatoa sp. nov. 3]|nr:MAG: hybrid sensor histidine kinase/response regulator [Gammaproteobacteria bacterium]RKZ63926.1 MAG: hybrid sensor histidine kinase/response regulator [Gammaproteobacteria bacterium]RKZ84677.1 MAG: hybrid sensor histidine kinase/response regulator [Gammaproteobacteria bacterium]